MTDLLDKARGYVEASNAHDLAAIRGMLSAGCYYCSAAVGRYVGPDAIAAMMEDFFAEHPDAHWQVEDYHAKGEDTVEFGFTVTLLGHRSQGTERLYFDHGDRICRIEVER